MPVGYHHKYAFTAWYKLEAKPSPQLGVSGTFTYFNQEGQPITSVGWATSTQLHQWTQLKAEFYPVKGLQQIRSGGGKTDPARRPESGPL
jgi:hypothetical protein